MASDLNDAVFPEEDLDDDDETPEDEDEYDDDVLPEPDDDDETEPCPSAVTASASGSGSAALETLTVASIPMATADTSPKRQRTQQIEEKKGLDDSRRLFQRLWTDEDEIGLLQGFLDYTTQRGSSHHNDTALFYDQIKSKLQLGFNKNQLVEKLRRLKKKYRNVVGKISSGKEFSFKSPHDRATFEISSRIWNTSVPIAGSVEDDDEINPNSNPNINPNFGYLAKTPPSRKRSRPPRAEKRDLNTDDNNYMGNNSNSNNNNNNRDNENCNSRHSLQGLIEETVRSCVSPVLKELVNGSLGLGSGYGFGGRGFGVGLNPLALNLGIGEMVMDDKWRKQHILELELYSKRLELVQDEIKVALHELRSAPGGIRYSS